MCLKTIIDIVVQEIQTREKVTYAKDKHKYRNINKDNINIVNCKAEIIIIINVKAHTNKYYSISNKHIKNIRSNIFNKLIGHFPSISLTRFKHEIFRKSSF